MSLRANAAHADITPRNPVPLAGYGARTAPFTAIASTLEANAVAFRTEAGRIALILTLDTLFVGPRLQAALADHFVRVHRQAADDFLVLASHTHFAPSVDPTKPLLGKVDASYADGVIAVCKALVDRTIAQVGEGVAFRKYKASSLAGINRRRSWPLPHLAGKRRLKLGAVMAPNPAGAIDPSITVWVLSAARTSEPIAVLWNYACHPTAFADSSQVSPDFPGVVRERLRRRFGKDLPVLFLQGFAGDIRARVPESRPLLSRAAQALLLGPTFPAFSKEGWERWARSLADDVEGALDRPPMSAMEGEPGIVSASSEMPLGDLVQGAGEDRVVRFQRLRLGPALDVVAVAAEPLTDLARLVSLPDVALVGYLGDSFGYWATDDEARRGGYEVDGFLPVFSLPGAVRRPSDTLFRTAVNGLRYPR